MRPLRLRATASASTAAAAPSAAASASSSSASSSSSWVSEPLGRHERRDLRSLSATPAAYSDAQACSSLKAAYAAAQIGDLALIKPGSYGNQTIDATSKVGGSCDGYTIGASLSGCVTLKAESPGGVQVGDLRPRPTTCGSWT